MHIDENGDAAGNYTILGVKLMNNSNTNTSTYGLFPFGTFIARSNAGENGSQSIPVSEMEKYASVDCVKYVLSKIIL